MIEELTVLLKALGMKSFPSAPTCAMNEIGTIQIPREDPTVTRARSKGGDFC